MADKGSVDQLASGVSWAYEIQHKNKNIVKSFRKALVPLQFDINFIFGDVDVKYLLQLKKYCTPK